MSCLERFPKSGQTLIVFACIGLASPAQDQLANAKWHRFTFALTFLTGRTPLPSGQGAATISPVVLPHIHIMGRGGGKSPFRVRFTRLSDSASAGVVRVSAYLFSGFWSLRILADTRGMLAHLQELWPTLVRVALTVAIAVGLWAISDPIGYVFAVILVAVVWLWDTDWRA